MSFLHVRLVEAVGLASTDLFGFADPYCKVHLKNVTHLSEDKVFKSEAKKKSTDPIFNCASSLNISPKDLDDGQLIIDIYDYDKARKKDDELGTASLPLSHFKTNKQFQGWLPIRSMSRKLKKKKKNININTNTNINTNNNNNNTNITPTPLSLSDNNGIRIPNKPQSPNKYKSRKVLPSVPSASAPSTVPITTTSPQHNKNVTMIVHDDNNNNNIQHNSTATMIVHNQLNTNTNANVNTNTPVATTIATNTTTPAIVPLSANVNDNTPSSTTNDVTANKRKLLGNIGADYMKRRDIDLQNAQINNHVTVDNTGNNDNNNTNALQNQQTKYDMVHADTLLHHKIANKIKIEEHGRRNRDSGRIYIVVYYAKAFHFGKMSNSDVKKTRQKNLKISNKPNEYIPINLFTLTFNCGNCSLSDLNDSLSIWLPNDGAVDLYALAFQELHNNDDNNDDPSSVSGADEKQNDLLSQMNQQEQIENYLIHHLGTTEYVTISNYKMWQTRIYIFSRKKYESQISNVTSHFHKTGFGGVIKNKGGVAISLDFDGLSLCFISCHLAAHQTHCDTRNTMYKKLCKNIKVGWPKQQLLGQFHYLFFMGDLNYRVNYFGKKHDDRPTDDTFQQICQILKGISTTSNQLNKAKLYDKNAVSGGGIVKHLKSPYAGLLKNDQLNLSKINRKAFIDFNEHHIKFPPSFKVKRQVGIHYITQRLPAWCDRILWRCPPSFESKKEYKVKNYRIYDKCSISDHKPVSCTFILSIWNRACGISDDCIKSIIYFRRVEGNNLIASDVNGKSDPFIHFPRQLLLEKYVQSKRLNKTLNPKWKDKHLKPLNLIRNSLPFLQKALLLFQIRDHDKFTANDLIACGYIELKYCVENLNKWVKFNQKLTLDGRDAGLFKGEIKLEYKLKSKK